MIAAKGVESNRLDAVGFGEMRPIETNKTDDGRAANRRVEFIIVDRLIALSKQGFGPPAGGRTLGVTWNDQRRLPFGCPL